MNPRKPLDWFILAVIIIVSWYVIRWAATEYWITTHCTMVAGTRVCQ